MALFLLHFVIAYFDTHIKPWFHRSSFIQQQYLCQWLTSSTHTLYPVSQVSPNSAHLFGRPSQIQMAGKKRRLQTRRKSLEDYSLIVERQKKEAFPVDLIIFLIKEYFWRQVLSLVLSSSSITCCKDGLVETITFTICLHVWSTTFCYSGLTLSGMRWVPVGDQTGSEGVCCSKCPSHGFMR